MLLTAESMNLVLLYQWESASIQKMEIIMKFCLKKQINVYIWLKKKEETVLLSIMKKYMVLFRIMADTYIKYLIYLSIQSICQVLFLI